jgi:hypothetical protein
VDQQVPGICDDVIPAFPVGGAGLLLVGGPAPLPYPSVRRRNVTKRKSVTRLVQLEERFKTLGAVLLEIRKMHSEVYLEYIEEAGRILDKDPSTFVLGTRNCLTSPITKCVHSFSEEMGVDECIFCGKPEGRK